LLGCAPDSSAVLPAFLCGIRLIIQGTEFVAALLGSAFAVSFDSTSISLSSVYKSKHFKVVFYSGIWNEYVALL
jgi:hypothetical protein